MRKALKRSGGGDPISGADKLGGRGHRTADDRVDGWEKRRPAARKVIRYFYNRMFNPDIQIRRSPLRDRRDPNPPSW